MLNEIIEWAVDILKLDSSLEILKNPDWLLNIKSDNKDKFKYLQVYTWSALIKQTLALKLRGRYISLVASKVQVDLGKIITNLVSKMEEYSSKLSWSIEHPIKVDDYQIVSEIVINRKAHLRCDLSEDLKHQLWTFDSEEELKRTAILVLQIVVSIKTGKKEKDILDYLH